ncbi:MAG: DUF3783 domain-containing protein [Acidobacteria bacterium]|nr:DUF3783 domain-containing protein [Acidobacteriota bacterium]
MNDNKTDYDEFEKLNGQPVILFHGFSGNTLNALIDALKQSPAFSGGIILATTTPTSIQWKIKDLLKELAEERAAIKKLNRKRRKD